MRDNPPLPAARVDKDLLLWRFIAQEIALSRQLLWGGGCLHVRESRVVLVRESPLAVPNRGCVPVRESLPIAGARILSRTPSHGIPIPSSVRQWERIRIADGSEMGILLQL